MKHSVIFLERIASLGDARVQWRMFGRFCKLDDAESHDSRAVPDSAAVPVFSLNVHEVRRPRAQAHMFPE